MNLELKVPRSFCYAKIFVVNGVEADSTSFGEQYDRNCADADPYGCGDMRFTRIPATPEVLERYRITEAEYDEVAERLEYELSFGRCNWCE